MIKGKTAKEIFDLRFFVRLGCIVVIIALAIFLYFYGKQRTLYVDNWSTEINGESYRYLDWAEAEVDDLGKSEFNPRVRHGVQLRGRTHTITIATEDDNFNLIELDPIEFRLPADQSIISLPALVAGLPVEECIQEFIPEVVEIPGVGTPAAAAEEEVVTEDDMFGDMSMDF